MPPTGADDFRRVHERLDTLFQGQAEIAEAMGRMEQRCDPCRKLVDQHEKDLNGNGSQGLKVRMATAESGRVDTLSVKSVCVLIAAVGSLAATIGAAMAALIK